MNRQQFTEDVLALVDECPQDEIEIKHLVEKYTTGQEIPEQQDSRHKMRTVLMELKAANEIDYYDAHCSQLSTLNGGNFIRYSFGIRSTRERATKQKAIYMQNDYRNRILKILYEKKAQVVNLRPYITEWIEEEKVSRQHISNELQKLQKKAFIWHDDLISLSLSWKGGQFDDSAPINAKIEPEGEDEYRKRNEPQPTPITRYSFKEFTGNFNAGDNKGSQSFEQASINPETQYPNNSKANKSAKTSWLEKLYWVVGILLSLSLLYEFVLRHFLGSPSLMP